MRPVFADPRLGFVLRRIFGIEEHKNLIVALLDGLLELDATHRIVDLEFLRRARQPVVKELRYSIIHLKCRDARGVTYFVEMQVLNNEAIEKRVVSNVAKAYVGQLGTARLYPELNDVIGITTCDFELWPDREGFHVPMLSRWRMQEQHDGATALSQLQFVFLELPKFATTRPPRTGPRSGPISFERRRI